MPLPTAKLKCKSKEIQQAFVSKVISFLDDEKPDMPHDQKVAIALSHARKQGASIPAKQEFYMNTNATELREFVDTKIAINEDTMKNLKDDLRQDIEELTVSSNIEVGPPGHPVPAGQDFKKDKLPGKRDKSDHGVEDDEVEDIEDTDDTERTGYTGTQPANAKKTPVGEADGTYDDGKRDDIFQKEGGKIYPDKEEPPDVKDTEVDDTDDTDDTERTGYTGTQPGNANKTPVGESEEVTEEELLNTIDNMTEEEFDDFIDNLDEEEAKAVHSLLAEYEEPNTSPDEIDASNPPDIGSEDEPTEEETEGKKHVAKQTEIMPEEAEPMDVVAHYMKKEK